MNFIDIFQIILSIMTLVALGLTWHTAQQANKRQQEQSRTVEKELTRLNSQLENLQQTSLQLIQHSAEMKQQSTNVLEKTNNLQEKQTQLQQALTQQFQQNLTTLQQELRQTMQDMRSQIYTTLKQQTETTNQNIQQLQKTVDQHLRHISGQVEKRLSEGFEKTNTIFTDVIKRLALIDKAQQEISDLSSNVVDLQDLLKHKQARGHFGEIQLSQLIKNCLPSKHFALQHTFKNGKRADCVLFLPEPTGTIAIDAKFPLDNYRRAHDSKHPEQNKALSLFKQDMKNHIKDVAEKYIIPEETCDAAVLFIPAESIFSDIHAHHGDLIDFAYQRKVWMVSPTTMMAILHTTQAVLKDMQTQAQVGLIKEHLQYLATDFKRFQERMDSVAKHINDANTKVGQVNISAQKISKRFAQIEKAELTSTHESTIEPLMTTQILPE